MTVMAVLMKSYVGTALMMISMETLMKIVEHWLQHNHHLAVRVNHKEELVFIFAPVLHLFSSLFSPILVSLYRSHHTRISLSRTTFSYIFFLHAQVGIGCMYIVHTSPHARSSIHTRGWMDVLTDITSLSSLWLRSHAKYLIAKMSVSYAPFFSWRYR